MRKIYLSLSVCFFSFCGCRQTEPPTPILPVPSQNQIEWQKLENYAFIHFGLNTFNDLEWGYGDTPATTFNPTDLDCDQWVQTIKAAGLKAVMLTAKHHDGFCLWPSQYTEYSVKNSPWHEGKGDMVKELSEACKRHNLKFGIYLSPWDRNHAEYSHPEYVEYFHNQMKELLTNYGDIFEYWFDGANGGDGWYGGANEKRSINPNTYYQYEKARETIKELQPQAVIFGGTCPDIRWIGNEEGWAEETNWSIADKNTHQHCETTPDSNYQNLEWLPGECDVSIRPGWFYHPREDHQVRSLSHLVDLYYRSVGRNATFLLNFPVALNGKIHPADSARAIEWRKTIDNELKTNLLLNTKAETNNYRGQDHNFSPAKTVDGNWDSYWATDDNVTNAILTFSFPETQLLNRILIQEYIPLGQRVIAFQIEYLNNGKWFPIDTHDKMTTIGYKRIIRFKTVKTEKIRINFTEARGPLCINNVEAFYAPALLVEPVIVRDGSNRLLMQAGDHLSEIYYTLDGSTPSVQSPKYDRSNPVIFDRKGEVKAISYDPQNQRQSQISVKYFDIAATRFKIVNLHELAGGKKELKEKLQKSAKTMFDGNGYTTFYLPASAKQEIVVDLGQKYNLKGFTYTPDQTRWGGGVITRYEVYVDNKPVAQGEFSNIKNNPIEQIITFPPTQGQKVRLVAKNIINGKSAGIAEFSVLTE